MEAFVKKKIFYNKRLFLEKTLPKEGEITVKPGDLVRPFDILGYTYISLNKKELKYPLGAKIMVSDGEPVVYDQVLVSKKRVFKSEQVKAPFSGIVKIDSGSKLYLYSPAEKFNLVSGIEAKVVKVIEKLAVLLETEAVIVGGVWSCGVESVGEIKIIENGNHTLNSKDLDAEDLGKILVYFGYVPESVLQKAKTIGVVGFVCASVENASHTCPINVLATEGFGPAVMSKNLRSFLSSVAVRTAVISPQRKQLIIPGLRDEKFPSEETTPEIREIKSGDLVQILVWPYFGQEAEVLDILGEHTFESGIRTEVISVKLTDSRETVKIPAVNVLILD